MAEFIKRNLDEKIGGAWHVIVGKKFQIMKVEISVHSLLMRPNV